MRKILGILSGAVFASLLALGGCHVDDRYDDRPRTAAVYETDYYWGGRYDGGYWRYRDHEGHEYRELRAEHERRDHERHDRGEHGRVEHHDEHHEGGEHHQGRD